MAAGRPDVSILITGIGRQNAGKSVREFLATNLPELVLTCGFAGGLNPDLKLGDVVFELTDRRGEFHEPQMFGTRITRPSERSEFLFQCTSRLTIWNTMNAAM